MKITDKDKEKAMESLFWIKNKMEELIKKQPYDPNFIWSVAENLGRVEEYIKKGKIELWEDET